MIELKINFKMQKKIQKKKNQITLLLFRNGLLLLDASEEKNS